MLCELPLVRALALRHQRLFSWFSVWLVILAAVVDVGQAELHGADSDLLIRLNPDSYRRGLELGRLATDTGDHVSSVAKPSLLQERIDSRNYADAAAELQRRRLHEASSEHLEGAVQTLRNRSRSVGDVLLTMISVVVFVLAGLGLMFVLTGGSVNELRHDPMHALQHEAYAIYHDPRGQFISAEHRSVDLIHQGERNAMDMYARGRAAGSAAFHAGQDAWKAPPGAAALPSAAGLAGAASAAGAAAATPSFAPAPQVPQAAPPPSTAASLPAYQAQPGRPIMPFGAQFGQRNMFCC